MRSFEVPRVKNAPLRRMRAGIGAIRDAVAVHIQVAAELLAGFQLLGGHHLAAVQLAAVVPGRTACVSRSFMPISRSSMHEHRRLQPVGQVERQRAELEALVRVFREQQHVLGVAVRGIGAAEDVGLLRARRHAGGRAGALHVEDHRGDFGEIRQADEFLHQRDAGPGRRGERARAVPGGADHHADRGQFVLGLHDGELVLAWSP